MEDDGLISSGVETVGQEIRISPTVHKKVRESSLDCQRDLSLVITQAL